MLNSSGHQVTVLVRNASKIPPQPNLTIVEGSVTSQADIDRAFATSSTPIDAALQFLNANRTSDNPWATFIGPPRLIADSTAAITQALHKQDALPDAQKPRLVVLNALGAGESYAVAPYAFRFIMNFSNIGKTYEDHSAVDAEIEQNCGENIKWTVVMAVGLGDAGQKPVKTFASTQSGAGYLITRESCARWMIDVATGKTGDEFSDKRVIVSN
jgi:putative NADH-flavin reductase